MPSPVSEMLGARALTGPGNCFDLTAADTRVVAAALIDAVRDYIDGFPALPMGPHPGADFRACSPGLHLHRRLAALARRWVRHLAWLTIARVRSHHRPLRTGRLASMRRGLRVRNSTRARLPSRDNG